MASASRAARCCINSSLGLRLSRSAAPLRWAQLSRGVATTSTPPPTPNPKKTTTTPTQKRPAPANKLPYNRRPASNTTAKSDAKGDAKPSPAPAAKTNGSKTATPQRQFEQNAVPGQAPPVPTSRTTKIQKDSITDQSPIKDMTEGLADVPSLDDGVPSNQVDWSSSFHGLSAQPFSKEAAEVLLADIEPDDVEVKPDGIVYLPEIKYRRILNRAFGPGGWGLAPRGETIVTGKSVTREYALVAHGRLVSVARGEQQYFSPEGIPTATEGCKSNALMRCCKDLGVASELWDPRFIRKFMKSHAKQIWVEHVPTKKKKQIWLRVDDEPRYPFRETKFGA